MKKIFIVRFDNGENCAVGTEEFNFKYCYTTIEQAQEAIEELKQSNDILEDYIGNSEFNINNIEFWVEELELVD